MVKCIACEKELEKPEKAWKYSSYQVTAYSCANCKTRFRVYSKDGKYAFTLKMQNGRFKKV